MDHFKYAPPTKTEMLHMALAGTVATHFINKRLPLSRLLTSTGQFPGKYLAVPFCLIPGVADKLSSYYDDPDEDITFVSVDSFKDAQAVGNAYTKDEATIMGVLCALLCNKTFASETQYSNFLVTRIRAIKAILKAETISVQSIVDAIPKTVAVALNETMIFYPKLKKALFYAFTRQDDPVSRDICNFVRYSQMAVFSLAKLFVECSVKTRLHFHGPVMAEEEMFFDIIAKMEKKYGKDLDDVEIMVNPDHVLTNPSSFKHLAKAAWIFTISHLHLCKRLKSLKGRLGDVLHLFALSAQPMKEEHLTRPRTATLNADFRKIMGGSDEFNPMDPIHSDYLENIMMDAWEVITKAHDPLVVAFRNLMGDSNGFDIMDPANSYLLEDMMMDVCHEIHNTSRH